jgi:hypothetical protein
VEDEDGRERCEEGAAEKEHRFDAWRAEQFRSHG